MESSSDHSTRNGNKERGCSSEEAEVAVLIGPISIAAVEQVAMSEEKDASLCASVLRRRCETDDREDSEGAGEGSASVWSTDEENAVLGTDTTKESPTGGALEVLTAAFSLKYGTAVRDGGRDGDAADDSGRGGKWAASVCIAEAEEEAADGRWLKSGAATTPERGVEEEDAGMSTHKTRGALFRTEVWCEAVGEELAAATNEERVSAELGKVASLGSVRSPST